MADSILAPVDQNALDDVSFVIDEAAPAPPGGGFPSLPGGGSGGGGGIKIPFQFPPRIKTSSKSAVWTEAGKFKTYEQAKVFKGADARKIDVEAEFVVTNNDIYSIDGISTIVRILNGYFYRSLILDGRSIRNIPVIKISKFYGHHGDTSGEVSAWRGNNISWTYSDELITDEGSLIAHPLKTTMKMSLELVTNLGDDKPGKARFIYDNVPQNAFNDWF